MTKQNVIFPAEWCEQSAIQLTWPHENTDWCDILDEVIPCFVEIAKEICKREKLIIVTPDIAKTKKQLGMVVCDKIFFHEMNTNDTWARDHGAISIFLDGMPAICDFTFNGWGMKFAANHDNQITSTLYQNRAFTEQTVYINRLPFVLEGGSIESDGKGTLLTTSECLLSANRNYKTKEEIESFLKTDFNMKRILWLDHGYLAGDDTDSHIDTLARFCDENTIAYVKCDDVDDEHYVELKKMEDQLKSFKTLSGDFYRLIALPMAEKVCFENKRLPATYANFLIINEAVLMPTYNSPKDKEAQIRLQEAFPDREIVAIDCNSLIKQHGSLHCITMQYPLGFI